MHTEEVRLVNTETGEVIPNGVLVHFPTKVRVKDWFMAWERGFERLAEEDLTGEALRVLMYTFANLDYENYVRVSQSEISEKLKLRKQNVSRAIRVLVEKQILLEGDREGKFKTYRLNSFYGWKGKVRNMPKE